MGNGSGGILSEYVHDCAVCQALLGGRVSRAKYELLHSV
jgi:hypothetical protein